MRRIRILEANQGSGLTRIVNDAWHRLLNLNDGYFDKEKNIYDFYTNDGLLVRAIQNSNDPVAKRFVRNSYDLFVNYCEPGLGYSIIESDPKDADYFLFRDTGFYNSFGTSFFIRFCLLEECNNNIPEIWGFENEYKLSELNILKDLIERKKIEKPNIGEFLLKINGNTASANIILKGIYYRKLLEQLDNLIDAGVWKDDLIGVFLSNRLKGSHLTRDFDDYNQLV